MMKIFRGLGIGAAVFGGLYLLLLGYFHLGKPNPKVDFLADWNRPVAELDEEQKAWLVYRPVWTKYGFCEGGGCTFPELYVDDPSIDSIHGDATRMVLPTDEEWPAAVEVLKKHQELLENFRVGAKLPSLGVELQVDARNYSDEDFAALFPHYESKDAWSYEDVWDVEYNESTLELMHGSLVYILLPHVQSFRKAARLIHADTRLAFVENDPDRCVANIETVWGLANQASEGNALVCSLVGYSVLEIGFRQLEEILVSDPDFFSESQLKQLQKAAEGIPVKSWLHLEGERAMIHDMIQRVYTDDGNGNGRMTAQGVKLLDLAVNLYSMQPERSTFESVLNSAKTFVAPASLFYCASRKEITEKTDEYIDLLVEDQKRPAWEAQELGIDNFLEDNAMKYQLLYHLFPAFTQVRQAMDKAIARQEAVIASLAIHRFFVDNNAWPESYEDVAPDYIVEFPVDQVNGSLLKFTYKDDELLVYSVGQDLDDDGGSEHGVTIYGDYTERPRDLFFFGPSKSYEGDWIVWPYGQQVFPTGPLAAAD